jgi:hypothetical protein
VIEKRKLGLAFLVLSLVPLGFLVYTLVNLQTLQIAIVHPRVIVEASIFAGFLIAGVWMSLKRHG